MELEKIIQGIEKYCREFIVYLVSFFWVGKSPIDTDPILEDLNQTVIFAIMSAAFGAYLWDIYIYDQAGEIHDLARVLTDTLLKWLSYGLLLFAVMTVFRLQVPVLKPILCVLRVFSVAYILSILCAYLARNAIWLVTHTSFNRQYGAHAAAKFSYAVHALLVLFYLPREIAAIMPPDTRRLLRHATVAIVLTVNSVVTLAILLDPEAGRQTKETIAGPSPVAAQAQSSKPGSAK